jgi:hypothetical protein
METHPLVKINAPRLKSLLISVLFFSAGIERGAAELPMLEQQPWLGYFVGFANKKFKFSFSTDGGIVLTTLMDEAELASIPITFYIEETLPDGKATAHSFQPGTLESAQPAAAKLESAVVRGKFGTDSSFELYIEQTSGVISMGGHVTNPGSLKTNPLRFVIQFTFSTFYDTQSKSEWDQPTLKAFEKKISRDGMRLKWTDGKSKKQALDRPVDAKTVEINGPGIAAAELDVSVFGDRKFKFEATPNSSMALGNAQKAPLYEGFLIRWSADAAKDTTNKARLSFSLK